MRFVLRTTAVFALCALLLALAPRHTFAAPPLDAPGTYIVQSGDTLTSIATQFHTTVAILKQLNNLGNSDAIRVGQKLIVPGAAGDPPASAPAAAATSNLSYVVQDGDSLYRIALRYGVTVRALENLNGIPNPNLITVGQALAIPGSNTVVKPDLIIDPPAAHQGDTVMIQVTRPDVAQVAGTFNGHAIPFTRAAGYYYALVGISRCAKAGNVALNVTLTDASGQTSKESATVNVAGTSFPVTKITLPPGKGDLLAPDLVNREAVQLAGYVDRYTTTRLWDGVFRQPLVGIVSAPYGQRRSYNGGPVGACGHEGLDLATAQGTPIHAAAQGRVVFAGLTQVRGNMTVIDHGLGVFTAYYHQSEIDVKVGQMVEPGQVIGKVGTTGLSTGPHLHWSLWVNGEYVDPLQWTQKVIP